MTAETAKILDEIRPELHKVLPQGARLLLFGSRARGDERPDSDWDLLVLLDHEGRATDRDMDDVVFPLYMILWDRSMTANVMPYTQSEWSGKKGRSLFYHNVMDDAIEVCR